MATASAVRTKSVNLGVSVNAQAVFATPTGLKLGGRGKVTDPTTVYRGLAKGQARKVRKACRAAGFGGHASAPRNQKEV